MTMTTAQRDDFQELRLAMVFNGGVSLAVWMGGVAKELDRFRTAFARTDLEPYRALLEAMRTEVHTDVIAGTSAGGINGALLGYAVARGISLDGTSGTDEIRKMWQDLGAIEKLLVCEGTPDSALEHRELFRGAATVFGLLSKRLPLADKPPDQVRLTITATDVYGYPVRERGVEARDHRLELRFRAISDPDRLRLSRQLCDAIAAVVTPPENAGWPFPHPASAGDLRGGNAPAFLARAARSTAAFPLAFAPSILPLDMTLDGLNAPAVDLTTTPPMREIIRARGELPPAPERFAVDGGLWDNAPFDVVLRAIDREPSARDVDRRLVYVIYTAPSAIVPADEVLADPVPNVLSALAKTVALPSTLSLVNDLERIRRDSERQSTRRRRFAWLIRDGKPDLFILAHELLPAYNIASDASVAVPPALLAAAPPLEALGLDVWGATPADWTWGLRPVQVAVELARQQLRIVLRELSVDRVARRNEIRALVVARDTLSQLARVLSDLADHAGRRRLTAQEQTVCGAAMAQYARLMDKLDRRVLARLVPSEAVEISRALATGGPAMIIKRALAAEAAAHTLAPDDRAHKVDYRLETIRPSSHWPLPGDDSRERPPLVGLADGHFGGFLLGSWRLSDWMWGRLDATTGVVDMLLDPARIERRTGGRPALVRELADELADLAIPKASPHRHRLACATFASHPALAARGPQDPAAAEPSQADYARFHDALVDTYDDILTVALAEPARSGIEALRDDVRRAIQYAILDEERPGLIAQIATDWADPALELEGRAPELDDTVLAAQLDGGLRKLTFAAIKTLPRQVLLGYGEHAGANLFEALKHPRLAALVRIDPATVDRVLRILAARKRLARRLRFWHRS